MSSNSRLVYSTESGRIKTSDRSTSKAPVGDGIVRVCRQTKGRGGKTVTVVEGVPATRLKDICKQLKALCAGGGALKEFSIEIQGDHREKIIQHLTKQGFQAKAAGG